MTARQKLFLISLVLGMLITGICVPHILNHFSWLYIPGELQASSPCGGGLAMILAVPMKIISFLSLILMWLANALSVTGLFLATQIPVTAFLSITHR